MKMKIYKCKTFIMCIIYIIIRSVAVLNQNYLNDNFYVNRQLHALWWKLGGRWADGLFQKGYMCQAPSEEDIEASLSTYTDVNIFEENEAILTSQLEDIDLNINN